MRRVRWVLRGPVLGLAVDPSHLHACVQPAHHVEVGVVADMQHVGRSHTRRLCGGVEKAGLGFGGAKFTGTQRRAEVAAQAHALDIRIAVGQGHQRKPRGQQVEGGQHIVEQLHPVALSEEDVESGFGQGRIIPRPQQQQADGLAPQRAEVVRQIGPGLHDVLAHHPQGFAVGAQQGGSRGVVAQPGEQHLFRPGDDGPDRPQRVVQVEGDGADSGNVQHGHGRGRYSGSK